MNEGNNMKEQLENLEIFCQALNNKVDKLTDQLKSYRELMCGLEIRLNNLKAVQDNLDADIAYLIDKDSRDHSYTIEVGNLDPIVTTSSVNMGVITDPEDLPVMINPDYDGTDTEVLPNIVEGDL
jgi:hypothetical protein